MIQSSFLFANIINKMAALISSIRICFVSCRMDTLAKAVWILTFLQRH